MDQAYVQELRTLKRLFCKRGAQCFNRRSPNGKHIKAFCPEHNNPHAEAKQPSSNSPDFPQMRLYPALRTVRRSYPAPYRQDSPYSAAQSAA